MAATTKIPIAFIIASLSTGGAQMMLLKLLSRIDRSIYDPSVFCLTDIDVLSQHFREMDIPVSLINMKPGIPDLGGLVRLTSELRQVAPRLIQTWMYHADLIGGLAACFAGRVPVIWNIRHSDLNPATDKRSTIMTAKLCARLSRSLPRRIVCCAESARDIHVQLGYSKDKFEVIPNGFDLAAFQPNASAQSQVREELGLRPNDFVVGLAARYHPQKDHRNFIVAAGRFASRFPQSRFILCGDGVDRQNQELVDWTKETGVPEKFLLLGKRTDMPAVTAAFDIACSASLCGEAFSNTIGEAMACGVPCAVTDVGDSAFIVGATGQVVPPGDPAAMAGAWETFIALGREGREALGERARARIIEKFSLDSVVHRYECLYQQVLR